MYWGEEIENEETHFPSWPTILFSSKLGGKREREEKIIMVGLINKVLYINNKFISLYYT